MPSPSHPPAPAHTRRLSHPLQALHVATALLALMAHGASRAEPPASCSSDGQRAPRWLLERFISADCPDCWSGHPLAPAPRGAVVLDWVVPADSGDDAPMAAVARREAQQRRDATPLQTPDDGPFRQSQSQSESEPIGRHRLRVQHGLALGGYVGASLRFNAQRGAQGPFTGWLAVVEWLPKGTEGSPVPRQLVRNLLTEPIAAQPSADWPYQLWRPMNLPEGTQPERLGVVGWVTDAQGRLVALAQARCSGSR